MHLEYVSQATQAYDTWLALRQIQQSLPSSGSAHCTSWWLLFAKAIILMRGVSGCWGAMGADQSHLRREGGFAPVPRGPRS
jgi:hypothetical protein